MYSRTVLTTRTAKDEEETSVVTKSKAPVCDIA